MPALFRTASASLRALLAVVFISSPAASQDSLSAALQERLEHYRSASGAPGAVLGVALPDGRVLAVAAGRSDTVRGIAMRAEDRLLLGSVGKTFVAATALQLVHERRLEVDALASRYVGGERWFDSLPNAAQITVRQLLNHTSGLTRYEFRPEFTTALTEAPDRTWDPREQVSYLHGTAAPFAAGEGWNYSDTNYLVLGLVIESIVGRPLDDEIALRFLRPRSLENTVPSDARVIPGVVQGYAGLQNPFGGQDAMLVDGRMIINPQFEGAGGGYAASAADAARWGALFFSGQLFGAELLAQATDGVRAEMLGPDVRYGLGMILEDSTVAGPVRSHSGFFPGYIANVRHYPDRGITLAVMVNASNVRMQPSTARWLDELATAISAPR